MKWVWIIIIGFALSLAAGIIEMRDTDKRARCESYFAENNRSHAGLKNLAGVEYAWCSGYFTNKNFYEKRNPNH